MNMRMIITVVNTTAAVVKTKPDQYSGFATM